MSAELATILTAVYCLQRMEKRERFEAVLKDRERQRRDAMQRYFGGFFSWIPTEDTVQCWPDCLIVENFVAVAGHAGRRPTSTAWCPHLV